MVVVSLGCHSILQAFPFTSRTVALAAQRLDTLPTADLFGLRSDGDYPDSGVLQRGRRCWGMGDGGGWGVIELLLLVAPITSRWECRASPLLLPAVDAP